MQIKQKYILTDYPEWINFIRKLSIKNALIFSAAISIHTEKKTTFVFLVGYNNKITMSNIRTALMSVIIGCWEQGGGRGLFLNHDPWARKN